VSRFSEKERKREMSIKGIRTYQKEEERNELCEENLKIYQKCSLNRVLMNMEHSSRMTRVNPTRLCCLNERSS
jgi:hypothetical protein